jgi:hypothetical protein
MVKTSSNQERLEFFEKKEILSKIIFSLNFALRKDRTAGLFLWLFLNCDHPYPSDGSGFFRIKFEL